MIAGLAQIPFELGVPDPAPCEPSKALNWVSLSLRPPLPPPRA